ncbi:MAG: TIM barrel protein [Anaerolineales bacterium]|nr:TIM barrel protein [Anaerolineales bacterium]MCW5854545.1 TIM barrel protein [Anaerolineales bacterium]
MNSTQSFQFGTVGSPISNPKKPGGSAGAALHIAALGLGALELGWVQSVRVSEATCAQIKAAAQQAGISLSIHAPYYINLNASQEEWPKARQRLMDAAHYGYLAGARDIIFHPGGYQGRSPAAALALSIPRLAACVEALRAAGNPVTLRPETMGKAGQLGSFAEVLELARAVPGVQPCLDFAHLHARTGDGSLNSYAEWVALLEAYGRALGEPALKTLSCHLSGIAYTAKGEKHHLTMAETDFRLEELMRALHDMRCAGRILSESPIMEEDALLFQCVWREVSGE